jgi:WD40 repeat protein
LPVLGVAIAATEIHQGLEPQFRIQANTLNFCKLSLLKIEQGYLLAAPALISATHVDVGLLSVVDEQITWTQLVAGIGHAQKDEFTKLGSSLCLKLIKLPKLALAVGYESGDVVVWSIDVSITAALEGKQASDNLIPIVKYTLHSEPVLCMDISTDWKALSGSADDQISVWNSKDQLPEKHIAVKHRGIGDVCIRLDDRIFATAGWDHKYVFSSAANFGRVRIFNFTTLAPLAILRYHRDGVTVVKFSSDKLLASGSKDCKIAIWEIYR